MKAEHQKYIVENILPNDEDKLKEYLRAQARMVLAKIVVLRELDPDKDVEHIELEAMLLASNVHTGLISDCIDLCEKRTLL